MPDPALLGTEALAVRLDELDELVINILSGLRHLDHDIGVRFVDLVITGQATCPNSGRCAFLRAAWERQLQPGATAGHKILAGVYPGIPSCESDWQVGDAWQ